jgi:hypothetical protein
MGDAAVRGPDQDAIRRRLEAASNWNVESRGRGPLDPVDFTR